jgi:ACR3 family arsenite efflux pump ArsB
MQKRQVYLILLFSIFLFTGCTSTFLGSVFVFTFSDIIWYVIIAFVIALLIGLFTRERSWRKKFWLWFILNIVITPVPGLIYLLAKAIGRDEN